MADRGSGVEGFPPLKPAELNILLALSADEMHGYGIMKDVRERSGGKSKLGSGTLYRTVNGLIERGWIEEGRVEEEGVRQRRYYRITGSGRNAVAAEVDRLEVIVASARKRGIPGRGFEPGSNMGGAQ